MLKKLLLVSAVLLFSVPAQADMYAGASIGDAELDTGGFDKSETLKLFLGSRRGNIGGEIAYIDFDSFKRSNNPAQNVTGRAIELSAIGFKGLGAGFEFFGKFGLLIFDVEANAPGIGVETDDGLAGGFGVGFQYRPIKVFSLRIEYQRFLEVSNTDVDILNFGFAIHF